MKKRIVKVISIVSILILCLLGYYFLNRYLNFGIPCIFKKITGYLCPGCGITRCIFAMFEGKFIEAFYYNSLAIVLLIPFLIYLVINIIRYIKGETYLKIPTVIVNLLLIIVILFGIVRNIL